MSEYYTTICTADISQRSHIEKMHHTQFCSPFPYHGKVRCEFDIVSCPFNKKATVVVTEVPEPDSKEG